MGDRSGRVNSAQNRMCGRDGVAGAATMTSGHGCVGSTGRRLPQGQDNGLRALRRRAGRKKGETQARRQRIRSFEPGLRPWKRRKVKQSKEGKGFHQGERAVWKKSGVWRWTTRMRQRVDRSWMNRRRSSRRSCEISRSSRVSRKSFRKNPKNNLQQQLQEVEQRKHDLMPEHQKSAEKIAKYTKHPGKRNLQKDSTAAEEDMRKLQEDSKQMEERVLFLSNKIEKNKMQDAEMAAELRSLHAGEERRGSNASQTGDGCLEALWQQSIALGANAIETFVQRLQREMGAAQGQMPEREEGRRSSEDE